MIQKDPIEIGEAALATLHLSDVLKGDIPRVGVQVQKEIIEIDKRIDALADDFVNDRLPRRLKMPRPFTYRVLLQRFTRPISTAEIAKLRGKFPEDATDVWLSFLSTLNAAYAKLAEMIPTADYATYLGPKPIMPTSDKTFEFFNQLWVIDNPLIAFQLMQCGALLPDQTTAILEFFPSLYEAMKAATLDALVKRNMREPSFMNLPPRSDRGLATFKQQRIVPYGPNIHVAPPPEPPAAVGQQAEPKLQKGLQTNGQKAAAL